MLDLALFEGRDRDGHVQETRRASRKRNSIRSTPRPRSRRSHSKLEEFWDAPRGDHSRDGARENGMNYELAKQLKDAGFPQTTKYLLRKYSLAEMPIEIRRPPDGMEVAVLSGKIEWEVSTPTLEELIEASPKNIGSATFVLGSANQGKKWVACYFDFVTNRCAELNESGSTPVEAVARLWLALYANTGTPA